jgi:ABC-type oligopeptide transport system substrate-binding subunit
VKDSFPRLSEGKESFTRGGSRPVSRSTTSVLALSGPDCVDPQQVGTNASLNVGRQLVDSLTDQDPSTGEIKPWLAEK